MEVYYLINDKKYLDTHLLREKLNLSKWELQVIMSTYKFPDSEIVMLQNRKLYSVKTLNSFIETLLKTNERQIN